MGFEMPMKWPLVATVESRDAPLYINEYMTPKDARLINSYAEKDAQTGDWWVIKRPGFRTETDIPVVSGDGLGLFYWQGDNSTQRGVYYIFGSTMRKNLDVYANVLNTTGAYAFEWVQSSPSVLVFDNGGAMYTHTGTVITQVTDVDLISPRVRKPVYLDGTLYVMNAAGVIQGSDLNNPASWSALNVITANSIPGKGVALAKHLSYVVALKTFSAEVFYNAGNATGSPLSRVAGAIFPYGCVSDEAVTDIDGMLFWPSVNKSGDMRVVKLDNMQLTVVSTPAVDRILGGRAISGAVFRAFGLRLGGHRFYVLKSGGLAAALVYDLDQNVWYWWTDATGTATYPFDVVAAVPDTVASIDVEGEVLAQAYSGASYAGTIFQIDAHYKLFNDGGLLIPVDIYTPNFDAGVFPRKKTLSTIYFEADQTPGSILEVRANDDDFDPTKWGNFRTVDLSKQVPSLDREGTFYRRAYNFRHKRNTPFRIKAAHLQMELGSI